MRLPGRGFLLRSVNKCPFREIGYAFRPKGAGEKMPWKESSVMHERMRFVIRAQGRRDDGLRNSAVLH